MSLLHEIQASILDSKSDLAPIFLKLRLLAARLGSAPLAEWVKHESEGYPRDADLPSYRFVSVSYSANFSGPFGSGIRNAPISPILIKKFAGEHWVRMGMRESIATIDSLLENSQKNGELGIDASDLILMLQGKVYEGYACNAVTGTISRAAVAGVRHGVRSRVLELTIELEKSLPDASLVTIAQSAPPTAPVSEVATYIAQQVIYGNVTSVSSTGKNSSIQITVTPHDSSSLKQHLISQGFAKEEADEIAEIADSETPDGGESSMGPKIRKWLAEKTKAAATGTIKIGAEIATEVLKKALSQYYGLG